MARDNLLKEKKALFISGYIGLKNSGGSAAAFGNLGLCKKLFSNHQIEAYGFCFKEKLADKSVTYLPSYTSRLSTFFNYYLGYAGGVTFSNIKTLHKIIQKGNYGYVFLDSSLLGKLAEHIKKNNPQTIILVFFHNIEKEFFAQVYGNKFLYRPLKKTAALNEKLSSQYADYLLCFNQRDAGNIEKYYHRKPGYLFPVIVNDRFNRDLALPDNDRNKITDKIELLFVGSDFPANTNGLIWFVQNVMPYVNAKLTVIGKGMEKYKRELESGNVTIIGTVENIDEYYYRAEAVVAPILYGSGMKVKIAEALMMGKTIFASAEAWQGYDPVAQASGFVCNSAEDFKYAVNACLHAEGQKINEGARKAYQQLYSPQSQQAAAEVLRNKLFAKELADANF